MVTFFDVYIPRHMLPKSCYSLSAKRFKSNDHNLLAILSRINITHLQENFILEINCPMCNVLESCFSGFRCMISEKLGVI